MTGHFVADAIIAIIFLTLAGLSVGNFATSIIYRLPRGLAVPNDPPYCDHCREYLSVRDLVPFFSWVVNGGKCRFCKVKIPSSYALVELSSAAIFIAGYFTLGIGEPFVIFLALSMTLLICAVMYFENFRYYNEVLIALFGLALVWRLLHDATLYGALGGAYAGFAAGIIAWCVQMLVRGEKFRFPPYILMMIIGGMILSTKLIVGWLLLSWAVFAVLCLACWKMEHAKFSKIWVSVSSIFVVLLLLWPQLITVAQTAFIELISR